MDESVFTMYCMYISKYVELQRKPKLQLKLNYPAYYKESLHI